MRGNLLADEMRHDAAAVGVGAVFPKINALPGAEREFAAYYGHGHIHRGESGANVRGHIVLTFGSVLEDWIAIRDQPREKLLEVAANIRIGVFLNDD